MALKRITEEEMNAQGVIAAPDILNGTPAQNKGIFDRMVRSLVAPAVNACVDAVEEVGEAQEEVTKNEAERVSNEEERIRAEQNRTDEEQTRTDAEADRVEEENVRVIAETNRVTAENARTASENARENAEADRSNAETDRNSAEQERARKEQERVNAEEVRASEFATLKTNAETATNSANTAADKVNKMTVSATGLTPGSAAAVTKGVNENGGIDLKFGIPEGAQGKTGNGIVSINKTDGNGAAGTYDTYTITMTDGSTFNFQVLNGANGKDGDGAGDMVADTYDPQGKQTDIFAYTDEKIAAIPAPDLNKKLSFEANSEAEAVTAALPVSADWRCVCEGGGLLVALGYGTNIAAYSSDGVAWEQTTMPSSANWEYLAYGNGVFVASTSKQGAAYSYDGKTWASITLPAMVQSGSVAYGNGVFVMVGSGYSATSPDGVTWTRKWSIKNSPLLVAFGSGMFLAISNGMGVAFSSSDGASWTETQMPSGAYSWTYFKYGNGRFVAVDAGSNVAVATADGIDWDTSNPLPSGNYCVALIAGEGKFVVLSYENTVASTSADGVTWTQTDTIPSGPWWGGVYGAGKYIATPSGSTTAAISTDGINWSTSYTAPNALFQNGADVTEAVKDALGVGGGGVFVAVYGQTTGEEIYNAHNAGQVVLCRNASQYGLLENVLSKTISRFKVLTTGADYSADWSTVVAEYPVCTTWMVNNTAWTTTSISGGPLIIGSSTAGSTKKFKLTVNDSGAISAVEVT